MTHIIIAVIIIGDLLSYAHLSPKDNGHAKNTAMMIPDVTPNFLVCSCSSFVK